MIHPLNNDPHALPSNEMEHGTRHPARFEPKQQTVGNTQPQQRMGFHAYKTAATLSIPNNALTVVVLDNTSAPLGFNVSGIYDGNSKLIIPATGRISGIWLIHAKATFDIAAAGKRQIEIFKNNTTTLSHSHHEGSNDQVTLQATILIHDPNASDFFQMRVFQDSGGPLNLLTEPDHTYFEAIHLW